MNEELAKVVDNGILFTFDEIKILLHACGVSEINGVYMPQKVFSEEDILYAMAHMERNGIIIAGSDGFFIRKDVQQMLQIMKSPTQQYIWSAEPTEQISYTENISHKESMEYFCYVSENGIVVSERYWKKRDTVKLRFFQMAAFENWKKEMRNDYCGY